MNAWPEYADPYDTSGPGCGVATHDEACLCDVRLGGSRTPVNRYPYVLHGCAEDALASRNQNATPLAMVQQLLALHDFLVDARASSVALAIANFQLAWGEYQDTMGSLNPVTRKSTAGWSGPNATSKARQAARSLLGASAFKALHTVRVEVLAPICRMTTDELMCLAWNMSPSQLATVKTTLRSRGVNGLGHGALFVGGTSNRRISQSAATRKLLASQLRITHVVDKNANYTSAERVAEMKELSRSGWSQKQIAQYISTKYHGDITPSGVGRILRGNRRQSVAA